MYRQRYPDDPGMHMPGSDSYTNVTYRRNPGFCERIQQSLVGIVIGLVLIVVSSGLLFWNEGWAVQTAQSLDEGLNVMVHLRTTEVAFDNNNGHLVFLQGPLQTDKPVQDPQYNLIVRSAKLRRTVEMYQWVEHETTRTVNEGDRTREETEYSYALEWRQDLGSSSSFHSSIGHENPSSMVAKTETFLAADVQVGAFHLSDGLIGQIEDFSVVGPSSGVTPGDTSLKYHGQHYFSSASPDNPKVGDLRVKFEAAGRLADSLVGPMTQVSVVAQQKGNALVAYQTQAGDELEMLHTELVSGKDIFQKAHQQNTLMTWGIRFGGWVLMFVGFGCLTSIVTTLVDWIPIVRELVAMGMATMNAAFSISLSLTVIALGWIRYRPWLGGSILVMALTPLLFARLRNLFSSSSSSRHRTV